MKRLILFAFMLLPAVWMEAQSSQQANVQSAAQFAYDANGNLTKDLTKGISEIQYNFLNLKKIGCISTKGNKSLLLLPFVFVLHYLYQAKSSLRMVTALPMSMPPTAGSCRQCAA